MNKDSGCKTGQRAVLRFEPETLPENPYDPRQFKADLSLRHETGKTFVIPAFYQEPQNLIHRGDREMRKQPGLAIFVPAFDLSSPVATVSN